MNLRVVFVGEIVGKTGVFTLKSTLKEIRARYRPDFIAAGADSATGGAGLGVQHAVYLRKLGIDCLTLGECAYYKLDMTEFFPKAPWVLRPANLPYENPGRGWRVFPAAGGRIAVISLLGQAGFLRVHAENPYRTLDHILERLGSETKMVLVDFHASATAEKVTMAAYADGRVSAVVGTHGKALTADARVSAAGTAAITDTGRTGSLLSVGGMDPEARIKEYLTALRVWEGDGSLGLEVQGIFMEFDDAGKAVKAESFRIPCEEKMDERVGNG
ncbi:MAG: TIGR00282 family metallophosphoesterase [Spirochaetes bacterium]|nr:TIGR00282 family metallophosphoesterase [Spirochaetota bacterium]